MPVKKLVVAAVLALLVILIAFLSTWFGSEFYVYVPGRYQSLSAPPSSPWLVFFLMTMVVGVFVFSRRYAALMLGALAPLTLVGPMIGAFFQWTPGLGHWLLTLSLFAAAIYVWTNECLNED